MKSSLSALVILMLFRVAKGFFNSNPLLKRPLVAQSRTLCASKAGDFLGTLRNSQRTFVIDEQRIKSEVFEIQKVLGIEDFAVDIWFCSEAKIREMNGEWRGKSKSTDVLSFPACEFVEPGVIDYDSDPSLAFEKHLGDIVIAPAYVDRQRRRDAAEWEDGALDMTGDRGVSRVLATCFDTHARYRLLVVHSLVHLLGYDHETNDEWIEMTQKEDEVLKALGIIPG